MGNDFFTILKSNIEEIILVILGTITLMEICDVFLGWFPFYSKAKRKREKKKMWDNISQFYKQEYDFCNRNGQERISNFLVQLGLKQDEFCDIKMEILRLQMLPSKNINEVRDSLKEICCSNETKVLINQKLLERVIYNKVDYFINLTDLMYEQSLRTKLAQMLIVLIQENLDTKAINSINNVVVSTQGNFLLGIKVAEILNKPIVKMRNKGMIFEHQPWEGKFEPNKKVIIIHDVLVTADQLIESIERFPRNTQVIGIFCLVKRTEYKGEEELAGRGYKVNYILPIGDREIESFVNDKNKN